MYFESRINPISPATNASEIVNLLDNYQSASYLAENGDLIIFVDDGHINDPFSEIAVVNQTQQYQIESLTWAWIKTIARKIEHVEECLRTDFVFRRGVTVPLEYEEEKDKSKFFTCSCCGRGFWSTLSKQMKFDKDQGYGLCQSCEKYW